MYQVGDSIFYPMHGAGKITAIEEKEVAGEKLQYYIIKMINDNMKVMIPKNKISKTNIRPVTDLETVKEIADMIDTVESDKNLPWKKRNKVNNDMIKSGSLKACAEVIYGLSNMKREEKLNSSERSQLKQAQAFLMSELKLVEGLSSDKKDRFLSRLTEEPAEIS
ncbi:MAG TPA: transcription factor YdeB [Candidatus Salinicoccus merdavium]|nr:transcription factor YdeB [Candidatus Salinicoccus merdavium]